MGEDGLRDVKVTSIVFPGGRMPIILSTTVLARELNVELEIFWQKLVQFGRHISHVIWPLSLIAMGSPVQYCKNRSELIV